MDWLLYAKEQADRFWSKVALAGPDDCWLWTAAVDKDGYGKFQVTLPAVNGKNPQKHVRAPRLALLLTTGVLPIQALHACDNPRCCNPRHLFDGSQKENIDDAVTKGRHPHRTSHGRARLSEKDVVEISALRGQATARALAARFSVCAATIGHIWSGRNWRPRKENNR